MKTYRVNQTELNELKNIVNSDLGKVNEMFQDEFNLLSDRLDHIESNATQITFHDKGHDFGNGTIDVTFRVISKKQ